MPPESQRPHSNKRRRHASSRQDGVSLGRLETLVSKQFMRLAGILLLGASLWFAANSADTLFKIAKNLTSPGELVATPGVHSGAQADRLTPASGTVAPSGDAGVILILTSILAGFLALQLATRWRKRAEIQIISVFLVFLSLLAFIRNWGWHPYGVFPLLVLVATGLFFFGRHLSHTGTRFHFLFTWGLFAMWWLLKVMINGDRELLPLFFILISLIFSVFHLSLLFRGFEGKRALSNLFETGAIAFNPVMLLALVSATLLKFYGRETIFFILLPLTGLYVISLLAMEYSGRPFRKTPFLITTLVLVSLLLPVLFWRNQVILLTGSLSFLLLIYSAQTKDQPSILVSLGLAALMTLVYVKDLMFLYIPAAFLGGLAGNGSLFTKGLIAGLFVPLVALADRRLLYDLDIRFSRKWFSRRRYRTLLKGVFLGGIYMGLSWIWQYAWVTPLGTDAVGLISWFSFHALFCLVVIPWLAAQRSSLLPGMLILSVLLTLVYPTLLTLQNMRILDLLIRDIPPGPALFPLHYIAAGLFLLFISVVLQYTGRAFKGSTLANRIFLLYAVVMVLFLLISEMILTTISIRADSTLEVAGMRSRLTGYPATLIILASGLVILGWGFLRRKRFGRTLALVILLVAAFKLIYLDLKSLSLFARVILLFATGSLFLVLSLGYAHARRTFRRKRTSGTRRHKSQKPRAPDPGSPSRDHREPHQTPDI